MVHADASTFAPNLTKKQVYAQVLEQATSLFAGQRNWVCNLANTSSLLHHALHSLPSPSSSVNWTGFYILYPADPSLLVLGPFHGHVACQTISLSRGVCGAAASSATTLVVHDVEEYPGHIACDGNSKSEIVVPVVKGGKVLGVLDVDCAEIGGFNEEDREGMEALCVLLAEACDWPIDGR